MASVCLHLALLITCSCWLQSSALSTQGAIRLIGDEQNPSTAALGDVNQAPSGSYKPSPPQSEAESEPKPEGEPSPEPESTEFPELPPFAEPVPNWEEALPLYGFFWVIHIYILGSLFAMLAVYSLVSLVRLRSRRLLSHGYFVALNLMMLLMGLDRAIYFFVDAYNYKGIFPLSVAYMLLGLGFPCLSSAFSILFLALLQSTQTRLVSPKIQRVKVLAGIIIFHFAVSLVVDITVGLFTKAQVLLLLCQGVFLIWGLFLSISYLVIFRRLHKSSVRQFREISRLSMSRRTSSLYGISPFMKKPRNNWGSAIKVTLFASFFGLTIGLLQLYGVIVVYGPLGEKIPEPWSWLWYQFAFRICELVMCILMSFVATQPFRYTAKGMETPMLMCCTTLCETITQKTTHELQDNDDYKLVRGDGDASLQGNDYNRGPERRVYFRRPDSEPNQGANLQLPPSNTFHRELQEELCKRVAPGTQTPEREAAEKNGVLVDDRKIALVLSTESPNAVLNNTYTPASAPIATQQWSENSPYACTIKNDLASDDIKSYNQNKNNHHSCPPTPLHHVEAQNLSRSNPSLSPNAGEAEMSETTETNSKRDEPDETESGRPRTEVEPTPCDADEAEEDVEQGVMDVRKPSNASEPDSTDL